MRATTPLLREREFQGAVVELAQLRGWKVAHFRPPRTSRGWRTPVEAGGAGFPDLLLVRGARLVVAELKGGHGRLAPAQGLWLEAFAAVPTVEVFCWRPRDWDAIAEVLR